MSDEKQEEEGDIGFKSEEFDYLFWLVDREVGEVLQLRDSEVEWREKLREKIRANLTHLSNKKREEGIDGA